VNAVSSEAEENKALVRRFLEEHMAKGNLDVIDELVAPDFVDRSLMPGQGPTREDFKRSVAEILDEISITSLTIEEQIAEGDSGYKRILQLMMCAPGERDPADRMYRKRWGLEPTTTLGGDSSQPAERRSPLSWILACSSQPFFLPYRRMDRGTKAATPTWSDARDLRL
jgi:hypothetical protein